VHPDGHCVHFIEIVGALSVSSAGPVDLVITDKDGKTKLDSKRERIEEKRRLSQIVASYSGRDILLASLLHSYDAAVRDPGSELIRLYEIRDALSKKFGDDVSARNALGIGSAAWSRFGRLCNDEPLQQGRHRGKASGGVRNATEGELIEARGFARGMIEAYLKYLQAPNIP
jgi:hypothetical protein